MIMVLTELSLVFEIFIEVKKFYVRPGTNVNGEE